MAYCLDYFNNSLDNFKNERREQMKITTKWLKQKKACPSGITWFEEQKETDSIKVLSKLIKEDKFEDANWLIVHLMVYKQYVSYVVYAAEQVFEKKYPNDKRPGDAINAAKKCIDDPSDENKAAARAAAYAAHAAAAYAAAYAAHAAAAYATDSAAVVAAFAAADSAADSADSADARKKMKLKILKYGIKLLKGED